MKLEDFIHVEKNAIPDEFCKQIIEEYDDSDDWKPGTINDYEVNEYRKCEVVYLSQEETLEKNDDELGKDIAMQVSANAPLAIYPDEIDQQILDKEKEIALATIENEKKPDEIKEKIVMGKLKKFKDENSLTEQTFIKNPDSKIKDLLRDNKILGFLRKKVGE